MKTSELTGAALDWAVAKCEGFVQDGDPMWESGYEPFSFSTDWSQGGPIIERERMDIKCWDFHSMPWKASMWWDDEHGAREVAHHGSTPLIAAMRCYVASKLGDDVDVPEGLTK